MTMTAPTIMMVHDGGNLDGDDGSKVHSPGAGQQHQQLQRNGGQTPQQLRQAIDFGNPRSPVPSQTPLQTDKRALPSSSSGPPPKKRSTFIGAGGGHPVKRVGTDTLHPPPPVTKRRRITGKRPGPR